MNNFSNELNSVGHWTTRGLYHGNAIWNISVGI